MLPGTTYTPEDVVRILWRRSWMILLPLVVGSVAAYWYAQQLPNLYRSETVLMLMPMRISDGYVKSAVNVRVEDRLITLKEQVMSRPNLEQLILDLNIYPDRSTVPMERLVARMNRDVTIKPEGLGAVRLTFTSPTPTVAQEVTERLAKLLADENSRDRENVAEVTNEFLDTQLADAKSRLLAQEKALEDYRRQYGHELPTQAAANLQSMQGSESRLRSAAEAADRVRQSRIVLERQLAELQSSDPALGLTATPAAEPRGDSAARQLADARAELERLLTRYREEHADVRIQRRKIAELEVKAQAETEASSKGSGPKASVAATPMEVARQKRIRELQVDIADIDRQLAENEEQQRKHRADVQGYQARLNALPARESELVELTRDYQMLQGQYNSLSAKRQESMLSANLERQNVGEQFRVLDPPRVPERPFSPNRMNIQMIGSLAGLALGVALIGFLEYRDATFKNEEEIFRVLELPVLAVIPTMKTLAQRPARTKRLSRILAAVAGVLVIGAGVAVWMWR